MFMVLCFVVAAILCFLLDRYFPEDRPLLLIIKYILTYWAYSLIAFGFFYIPSTHNPEVYIPIAIAFLIAGTAVGIYKSVHEFETFDSPPKSSKAPRPSLIKDVWKYKWALIVFVNIAFLATVAGIVYRYHQADLIYCAQKVPHKQLTYLQEALGKDPDDAPVIYVPRCDAQTRLDDNIRGATKFVGIILAGEAAVLVPITLAFLIGRRFNRYRKQSREEALAKYASLKSAYQKNPDKVKLMMIEKLVEKHPWLIDVEAKRRSND